ncbi:MAG TPA: glycerophosphodiester phosphodiesterase [Candidatus Tectomicrobia bacterium]|nr:glycerophosphodiester phosphodiesterase [Candidatus Tectomicrobia bacterium]
MGGRRAWGVVGAVLTVLAAAQPVQALRPTLQATVEDLLALPGPFAIGHRGSGENLGEDGSKPIENTVTSVRTAFAAGITVLEVDVQVTGDGEVAVFHDDVLPDDTCLNALTLREIQARLPHVPSLQAILNHARQFNQASGPIRGLVIVEMKASSPRCDPDDTMDAVIAAAVAAVVHRMQMTDQVILASLSPALLYLAASEAPGVARALTVNTLQFLTADEIRARGWTVTPIAKALHLGLPWAEVSGVFRLPGYAPADVVTTAAIVGARVVEADAVLLSTAGTPFVDALHGVGLKVFGYTADQADHWALLVSLGVDGIYTNHIELGLANQAPIP